MSKHAGLFQISEAHSAKPSARSVTKTALGHRRQL